ncbi:MAG: hypothetical protein JXQ99_05740 [Hyphomicrobiaceae bacterium]
MDLQNDLFVSPDAKPRRFRDFHSGHVHEDVETLLLEAALSRAKPGQKIHLAGGAYQQPQRISLSATRDNPTEIVGQGGVLLDPGLPPATSKLGSMTPNEEDFAFFNIHDSDHLILSNLNFANCWPSFIFLRNCRDITIQSVNGIGSQFVVFARTGRDEASKNKETARIALREVKWTQDPDGLMASGKVGWSDVKTYRSHSYFNGALFGSWDIAGEIEIDRCEVRDAFNGIRMDCHHENRLNTNSNVWVHDCKFIRIRDNAIEPEKHAFNWWIQSNYFETCHAPFSLHNLSGGWLYIFANELRFDGKVPGDDHTGGKVFKFTSSRTYPTAPVYVFHNSASVRTPYAKKGQTRNLHHFNNAIEYDFDSDFIDPHVGFFSKLSDSRVPYIRTQPGKWFRWNDSYKFGGDVSNHPHFRDGFPEGWPMRVNGRHLERVFGHSSRHGLYLDGAATDWIKAIPFTVDLPDGNRLNLSANGVVGARTMSGAKYGQEELTYRVVRDCRAIT